MSIGSRSLSSLNRTLLNPSSPFEEKLPSVHNEGHSSTYDEKNIALGDPNEGAIRPGGAPNLFTREHIGLLANYAAVGIVCGGLPSTIFPYYLNYLNLEGYQCIAVATLVSIPWSYKTFFGILMDSFPVFGYRRKPYMILGWTMAFIVLLSMSFVPVPEPYFRRDIEKEDRNGSDISQINNVNSRSDATPYVFLMTLTAVGYIIADVACDGMVVELAQREPLAIRGQTQTTIYFVRAVFSGLASLIIACGMNGREYGGKFSFSIPINVYALIFASASGVAVISSILLVKDSKVVGQSFKTTCSEMWNICQKRVIWQVLLFQFSNTFLYNISTNAAQPVESYWAEVVPFTRGIFHVLGNICFAGALWMTKTHLLNADWRLGILYTTLLLNFMDAIVSFLTIYDVVRNQWFWLGMPVLEHIPEGVRFIIGTFVVVEVAEPGYEAGTYGLITTIANLAGPCAATVTKLIDKSFDVTNNDIMTDTPYVRDQVAYTFLISYGFSLFSNVTLFLLPKQKKETQLLVRNGGKSKIMGMICISGGILALLWATSLNVLSILPSTSCLAIAGGGGCP